MIRLPDVWFRTDDAKVPVVMQMGDTAELGNHWCVAQRELIETKLVRQWRNAHRGHQAVVSRTTPNVVET